MYSHPGKELKQHLLNVQKLGMRIFKEKKTVWSENKAVEKTLELILYTHDFGKATSFFQEYINNPLDNKWRQSKNNELKAHSLLSAYFTYYKVKKEIKNKKLATISFLIVLKHHGNLNNCGENNFAAKIENDSFNMQIDEFDFDYFNMANEKESFIELLKNIKEYWSFADELDDIVDNFTYEDFLLTSYFFSILISADKGEAIYYDKAKNFEELIELKFKDKFIDKNSVNVYKNKKFGVPKATIDNIREEIYKEVEESLLNEGINDNRIFSINVPTGTGKTLTSFNAALKFRDKLGGKYKIIYTLPFTSIIEQNYEILDEILKNPSSEILLKHHYLSQKDYKQSSENFTYDISEYLIENWDSEIIVTTFVQLLESVFSNKNRKLKKIHNIVNSIIILDEVQSIPYKYWKLINEIFIELARCYNTYFILVTATLPLLFSEEDKEIIELAKSKTRYFNQFNRIELNLKYINRRMNLDEFLEIVKMDIDKNRIESYLFIMNTIKSSLKIYEELKKKYQSDYEIIYLSTNIIPKERSIRIKKIKNSRKVIVVSTQLIEAGVDIDIKRVYRDMASLDSINQSCGRCNRNNEGEEKGEMILVNLIDMDNKNKEYSKYIYGDILLKNTKDILIDRNKVEEKDFLKLANKYYEKIEQCKSNDISNNILRNMSNLNYDQAFDGKNGFRLIDNDFKTVDLFICIDNKSQELWQEYEELIELDKYNKKEAFDKIKSDFLSYVISVPDKCFDGIEGFNLIDSSMLEAYYDYDIGYKREENIKDYFF